MNTLRFVGCWMLAGLAEFPLAIHVYASGDVDLRVAVAGHILAGVLIFLAVPRGLGWWSPLRLWALWGAVATLMLPGMGWLLTGVFYLAAGGGEIPAHLDEEDPTPRIALPKVSHELRREERIAAELDFIPLVEILAGDDLDLKHGAIEQLERLRTPEAVQMLLQYRSDPSLEIRYYINSALARIKNEFDEELEAARQQMQMDVYKVSARVFLAKIYLQYARSGLLDSELAQNYEDEAIYHLTFAIESATPTAEAFRILIDCRLQRHEWMLADAVVEAASENKFVDPAEADRYRVEILYHTRRFAEIPALLRRIPDYKTAAQWWGAGV